MIGGMELKLERSKIELTIYGEVFHCTKPTLEESMILQTAMKDAKEDTQKIVELMVDFCVKRGIKKDFLLSMEMDHVEKVLDVFVGKKKG